MMAAESHFSGTWCRRDGRVDGDGVSGGAKNTVTTVTIDTELGSPKSDNFLGRGGAAK